MIDIFILIYHSFIIRLSKTFVIQALSLGYVLQSIEGSLNEKQFRLIVIRLHIECESDN